MNRDHIPTWETLALSSFFVVILVFGGCGNPVPNPTQSAPSLAQPDDSVGRISSLEIRLAAATESKDELSRLSALRDLLQERERQATAEAKRLQGEVKQANEALDAERQALAQSRIWWFAGIMGVLALAGAGLAIFIPSIAKWALRLALAAAAVSALAVFAAWLMPYLWWIGGGLLLVGGIGTIVYWRLDAKSRDQVVQAFEKVKGQVPDYKAIFAQTIDSDADNHLDKVRERLGIKKRQS